MKKKSTGKGRRPAARARTRSASRTSAPKKTSGPRKMKAYATFDLYLADQAPRNQAVIRALRKFVKGVAPKLEESVKWGNGCWVNGKAPVSYVYSAPGYVQLGFFHGAALDDPKGLLEGKGAYVRHIKVRTVEDIDAAAFGALLRQAAR